MTDKPTITQDYHAATKAFDNVLGHAGSYAEYGRPSDREAGVRSLTQDLAKHREAAVAELQADKERLDYLAGESLDLRCFPIPTGGDDADIGWRVIGHYMAEPTERIVGEAWTDNPRAAIDDAIANAALAQKEPVE